MRQDLFLRVTKIVFDYVGNIIDVVKEDAMESVRWRQMIQCGGP